MSKRDKFEVIKPCFLCFLCMWDSRDRSQHYTKKDWPLQEELVTCQERNVINDPLVDRDRILIPPLHIKLGLIKDGDCFTYLSCSSSEIQKSKRTGTKWNWKRGRLLFW